MITLFLSHAFEDKADFVRPLAEALRTDFNVWYDEYQLKLGDSLLEKINSGLASSDYGIVVLSSSFFSKRWPQAELDGLFSLEAAKGKVILPVWKDVNEAEVRAFSPILAGRLGVSTKQGLQNVIYEIKVAVGLADRYRDIQGAAYKSKFITLNEDLNHRKAAQARGNTTEGVRQVSEVAKSIISEARKRTEELIASTTAFPIRIVDRQRPADSWLTVSGPRRVSMHVRYDSEVSNSIEYCKFTVGFFRDKSIFDSGSDYETIQKSEFKPMYDREFKVFWQNETMTFSTGDALLDYAFERFADLLTDELSQKEG